MNDDNSCLVDYELETIPEDWSYQAAGHKWALPNTQSTRKCLREVFTYLLDSSLSPKTHHRVMHSRKSIFPKLSLMNNGNEMYNQLENIIISNKFHLKP